MSEPVSPEREGAIFNRGVEKGPIYGIRGVVNLELLRRHVWDNYDRSDRRVVVAALDDMLKVIGSVAKKGAVVRGRKTIDPLDSLQGRSSDLDTDLESKGLIVMTVSDLNDRYGLNLTRKNGFHPKIWMSIVGPNLRRGLRHDINKNVLGMLYGDEPNFDKTVGGLAGNVDNHFDSSLPPGVRPPFPGIEIVNTRLYELSQRTAG